MILVRDDYSLSPLNNVKRAFKLHRNTVQFLIAGLESVNIRHRYDGSYRYVFMSTW